MAYAQHRTPQSTWPTLSTTDDHIGTASRFLTTHYPETFWSSSTTTLDILHKWPTKPDANYVATYCIFLSTDTKTSTKAKQAHIVAHSPIGKLHITPSSSLIDCLNSHAHGLLSGRLFQRTQQHQSPHQHYLQTIGTSLNCAHNVL